MVVHISERATRVLRDHIERHFDPKRPEESHETVATMAENIILVRMASSAFGENNYFFSQSDVSSLARRLSNTYKSFLEKKKVPPKTVINLVGRFNDDLKHLHQEEFTKSGSLLKLIVGRAHKKVLPHILTKYYTPYSRRVLKAKEHK